MGGGRNSEWNRVGGKRETRVETGSTDLEKFSIFSERKR